ncbi:Cbb3-type cytochrome oxidase assembly protein CcoS [Georgfuchsia toluolica]|uniref:Cbb3-type cytochrome oxidase assembly protein CcoS n=1 Tax=Georgfuchsia toluolica TaxID=424218 RepID=A0A916J0R0_9PROT|nr:cbb3-type cytochrome oxidase assembly protein CcoS [Georgfuchsia toluolica]CAG4882570.1 Cbb3-type cytochrome oxidase assembly protein CcoS [Georgfuchsia toluolica]
MEILYLLIPMSVVLVFAIALIFWWSVKSGQFEDLEGPAYRILMDDDTINVTLPTACDEKERLTDRAFDLDQLKKKTCP